MRPAAHSADRFPSTATRDRQHAAGDKGGRWRDEPGCRLRDLFRSADAAQRSHPLYALAEARLSDLVAGQVGCGEAWRDRIDPDPLGPDFGCEALGEALDRTLGGRI